MGAGIARVAASAGHPVLLFDARAGVAAAALTAMRSDLDRQVTRGKLSRADADATAGRIAVVDALGELAPAHLVIEAIVEDRAAKIALFRELEGIVAESTLLATNTSSISVTAIAGGLRRPERCVGMHFFNPAPVMKLVEIVRPLAASPAAVVRPLTTEDWAPGSVTMSSRWPVSRSRSTAGSTAWAYASPVLA